jgi:hypothetical protein
MASEETRRVIGVVGDHWPPDAPLASDEHLPSAKMVPISIAPNAMERAVPPLNMDALFLFTLSRI